MKIKAFQKVACFTSLLWGGISISLLIGCNAGPVASDQGRSATAADPDPISVRLSKSSTGESKSISGGRMARFESLSFRLALFSKDGTALPRVVDSVDFSVKLVNAGGFVLSYAPEVSFEIVPEGDQRPFSVENTSTVWATDSNEVTYHLQLRNPSPSFLANEVFVSGNLIVMVDDGTPDCQGYINIDDINIWKGGAAIPQRKLPNEYTVSPGCASLGER